MLHSLIGFALAILPIVLTPGASFTLMAAHALGGDRGAVPRIAAGTALGILSHAVLAAVGLSAVVMQSAQVYRIVQFAGALYLIGLGVLTILQNRRAPGEVEPELPVPRLRLRTAFLANLLNPKAAAVYLTLVPQFLAPEDFTIPNVLALACVHAALTAAWLLACAAALRTLRARRLPIPGRAMAAVGGAVLIGLGVRTLLTARPA
ncbi:LysE family translocator [Glycomyces sp. NPDC047010]|uniref:LysE family translocator n=1 Tax=Glycomyces sp. NPDC047010 TaxID=3155023 RepID=UPI0033CAB4FC